MYIYIYAREIYVYNITVDSDVFSFLPLFFPPLSVSIKRNIKSIWIGKEASVKKRAVEISFSGKISER